ncbi:prenyltransferase [Vulcanisaeta thermophila]|uniref:prenyltransferase n=1 Tax=Vulcanisaeta thermophila TaxID=867917 RepID=UPI0008537233|nr:prenyltransferase [Vulcanisaeta thermophila]
MGVREWFIATNPRTLMATAISATIGALTAYYLLGVFDIVRYVLTVVGVVLAQAGVNLINDYYDFKSGADVMYVKLNIRHKLNPIIELGLSERSIETGGYLLILVAALIGLYLGFITNLVVVLILIITGAFLGISYSVPPLRLRYRGFGEVFAALALGPLTGLGAFAVQTGYLSPAPFINTLPNACFTFLALLSAGMLHRETDAMVGKRTAAVVLGPRGSGVLTGVLLGILYSSLVVSAILNYLLTLALAALVTAPLAIYYALPMFRGVLSGWWLPVLDNGRL